MDKSEKFTYRPDIDGLSLLAVLSVMRFPRSFVVYPVLEQAIIGRS